TEGSRRMTPGGENANYAALIQSLGLLVAMKGITDTRGVGRVLAIVSVAVFSTSLVLTGSRTGLFAIVFSAGLLFYLILQDARRTAGVGHRLRRSLLAITAAAALLLALTWTPTDLIDRDMSVIEPE